MLGNWGSVLTLSLLAPAALVGAFPSADHMHKLMGHPHPNPHRNASGCPYAPPTKDASECPYAAFMKEGMDANRHGLDKRFLFSLMNKPVDSRCLSFCSTDTS